MNGQEVIWKLIRQQAVISTIFLYFLDYQN
jgi:hypothetical protein